MAMGGGGGCKHNSSARRSALSTQLPRKYDGGLGVYPKFWQFVEFYYWIGGFRGENGETPNPKSCCRNSIFLLKYHQKISKVSQNFPTICVFRPKARKINASFVKFFEIYAKRLHFTQCSDGSFWKDSKILRSSSRKWQIFEKIALKC